MARSDIGQFAEAVTPSDTATIPCTLGLYIGVTGTVVVDMKDGGTITFVGATAGTVLPIQVVKVHATGTTAASIVALY